MQTRQSLPRREDEDDERAEKEAIHGDNDGGVLGGRNRGGDPASKRPRIEATSGEFVVDPMLMANSTVAAPIATTTTRRTNDEIHSTIRLCPTTSRIIDTPEFQRLKGIKQLGTADYVYMNCNTTRFEHSIGVMELARRMATNIRQRQPHLQVTDRDVLCVSLAGLLHDVGHGPFSHVYEQFQEYLEGRLRRERNEMGGERDHDDGYGDTLHPLDHPYRGHESVSLFMIHSILNTLGLELDVTNLDAPLPPVGITTCRNSSEARLGVVVPDQNPGATRRGLIRYHYPLRTASGEKLTSRDMVFVQECIWGQPVPEYQQVLGPGFHGRPHDKEWMYDIVCNKHSGLDVGACTTHNTLLC